MRRHQLQNEGQAEEDTPTPPTSFGEEVSRLTNSDKSVGRRAGAAKICREASALSALQQNREHQHDAIDYQQR